VARAEIGAAPAPARAGKKPAPANRGRLVALIVFLVLAGAVAAYMYTRGPEKVSNATQGRADDIGQAIQNAAAKQPPPPAPPQPQVQSRRGGPVPGR
jgi:hypothetical protein